MAGPLSAKCDHAVTPLRTDAPMPGAQPLADAAAMFRALGDPHRLRLLTRLSAGEVCVTELAAQEGEKLSTISARLKTLHAVRLVTSRREARHIYYSVNDDHVASVVRMALAHATEPAAVNQGAEAMTSCNLTHHADHGHQHGRDCGHVAVNHAGHVDYLHDGHLHHVHGDHIDEHVIDVSVTNPDGCTPDHHCAGHAAGHVHGAGCGHEAVPHGDHVDYLVDGHLHHPHGGHCDNHGRVAMA